MIVTSTLEQTGWTPRSPRLGCYQQLRLRRPVRCLSYRSPWRTCLPTVQLYFLDRVPAWHGQPKHSTEPRSIFNATGVLLLVLVSCQFPVDLCKSKVNYLFACSASPSCSRCLLGCTLPGALVDGPLHKAVGPVAFNRKGPGNRRKAGKDLRRHIFLKAPGFQPQEAFASEWWRLLLASVLSEVYFSELWDLFR